MDTIRAREWMILLEAQFYQSVLEASFAFGFLKVSIALSLLRLSKGTKFSRTLWTLVGFIVVYTLFSFITFMTWCQPISGQWNFKTKTKCYDKELFRDFGLFNVGMLQCARIRSNISWLTSPSLQHHNRHPLRHPPHPTHLESPTPTPGPNLPHRHPQRRLPVRLSTPPPIPANNPLQRGRHGHRQSHLHHRLRPRARRHLVGPPPPPPPRIPTTNPPPSPSWPFAPFFGSLQLHIGIIAACAPTLRPLLGTLLNISREDEYREANYYRAGKALDRIPKSGNADNQKRCDAAAALAESGLLERQEHPGNTSPSPTNFLKGAEWARVNQARTGFSARVRGGSEEGEEGEGFAAIVKTVEVRVEK